jgi:hypothetical protein
MKQKSKDLLCPKDATASSAGRFFHCRYLFDLLPFFSDHVLKIRIMCFQTARTVLDPSADIRKIAAALIAQHIKRAIAEQTVEIIRVIRIVARKVFTFPVAEKTAVVFRISIHFRILLRKPAFNVFSHIYYQVLRMSGVFRQKIHRTTGQRRDNGYSKSFFSGVEEIASVETGILL